MPLYAVIFRKVLTTKAASILTVRNDSNPTALDKNTVNIQGSVYTNLRRRNTIRVKPDVYT